MMADTYWVLSHYIVCDTAGRRGLESMIKKPVHAQIAEVMMFDKKEQTEHLPFVLKNALGYRFGVSSLGDTHNILVVECLLSDKNAVEFKLRYQKFLDLYSFLFKEEKLSALYNTLKTFKRLEDNPIIV